MNHLFEGAALSLDSRWNDAFDSSLSERDNEVLALLSEEGLATFSFDGLKRRLGLHPETLSRILDRLEEEGIVKKEPGGYSVTPRLDKFLRPNPASASESYAPLLQTFLPTDLSVNQLILDLKGRWFGLLRWLGLSGNGESTTLKWITEDGAIQIDANISNATLTIDAKFLQNKNMNLALKACYQLLTHIAALSSPSRFARHVSYSGDSDFSFMPA